MEKVLSSFLKPITLLLITLPLVLTLSGHAWTDEDTRIAEREVSVTADERPFRKEFIKNHRELKLEDQVRLVKKNKEIMPGEIRSLIKDASADGKSFEEKMYLLDIAMAMAYMYKYWHGGGEEMVRDIEGLVRRENQKEEERITALMKWKKEERFPGNFVMKRYMKEMEAEGLSPVLYPHWIHRIWFQCKVCHNRIFNMKRWTNDISQKNINEGKQCGVCHNGKLAFAADQNCERCHIAGKPGAKALYDIAHVDHEKIKEVAKRFGAQWHPENLKDGKLPLDRFRYINWAELKKEGAFKPVPSLDGPYKEDIRDNRILFESNSTFVNNVLFDHNIHSSWIECSSCHPAIFKEELGINRMHMTDMVRGQYCGYCHGKVSFTFADCMRCHTWPKSKPVEGALIHRTN